MEGGQPALTLQRRVATQQHLDGVEAAILAGKVKGSLLVVVLSQRVGVVLQRRYAVRETERETEHGTQDEHKGRQRNIRAGRRT